MPRHRHDMLCRAITHRQRLIARGLSREGADAMPSATSMRRSMRVDRRTPAHAGGRAMPRTLPIMSMPLLLRAAALAARVHEVDALADADAESSDMDATIDIRIRTESVSAVAAAPPDLQAAASDLNLTCLSLAPRLAAAPSIRARVSRCAWLSPCVLCSSE